MADTFNKRILVIEDDPRMLQLLCKGLREVGHTTMPASDGDVGLELAMKFDYDVIVLDIGLPTRDGYEITRALRAQKKTLAILMLTARDAEDDIIQGFELGADDYLVKPFSFPEMLARLNALTRPSRHESFNASLHLNSVRLTASRDNTVIPLTRTEFQLLALLNEYGGAPVTRQMLMDSIWGLRQTTNMNTLDVLVNALRNKFDAPYKTKRILTVRGVGYRLDMDNPGSKFEDAMDNARDLPS
jgi:DNA-binding response OmpR family regulator